jgi:hypothetical protein
VEGADDEGVDGGFFRGEDLGEGHEPFLKKNFPTVSLQTEFLLNNLLFVGDVVSHLP